MDDKALRGWVSDNLFALVGLSESSLASFIVALGALKRSLLHEKDAFVTSYC